MSTLAATSSPCHGNKTRGIANALTGLGKNVLRFRICSTSSRAQVGCYFWKPDPSADADSDDLEFSVGIFSGSWLPEELSKLDLVQISHKELSSGIWLIWDIDSSEDFNLLLKPGSSDSRYYFNGLLLDAASADAEHKDNFLVGKSAIAPPGLCGGMYLGPWDQDYHVPNSPSSPDGAPRLIAYNLNAGKSTRINRKHFDGASKHPAALPKMPAWLDLDPAAIGLDELEIKRVVEVFNKFDHDNNQVIDRHEMSRVAKHVYEILKEQPVTPEQIDLLFEKYDTNRDKQLSLIEFQKIFLSIKKEMIREGLLPPYPKHFQWRVSSHVPHVSSIKRRVDTPEPSDEDWGQMAMYQPANTSMYQFFNPQFYQNASYEPAALYQHQAQQPLYQPAFTVPYFEDSSSSDDSDDDLFTPSPFQFPQPATGMSHKLMFPELPCLQELSYLKHELPYQDYVQVQAGFLRFLKMRLGFSETPLPRLPHPHQSYAAPPHHHPYAAHSAHYQQ
ncbi:MAG: EF-hand domain-containing protein, partial [archaeon]|nr:EF-hand domain-containing protein [archaeon]